MRTKCFSVQFNAPKFWMFGARTPPAPARSCVSGTHVAACGGMVCLAFYSVLLQRQGPTPPWSFPDIPPTRAGLKHVVKIFKLSWNYLCQLGQWALHFCLTPILTVPKYIDVLEGRWPHACLLLEFFCLLLVACYNTSLFWVNYGNLCKTR